MFYEVMILDENKLVNRTINFNMIIWFSYTKSGFYELYYYDRVLKADKASFELALKKLKIL
jgi:hypothetical protein